MLRRIPEKMDPALYYKTFRPYIRFFESVVYEGVGSGADELPRRDGGAEQHHADAGGVPEDPAPAVGADQPPGRHAAVHAGRASRGAERDRGDAGDSRDLADAAPFNDVLEAIATFREIHFGWANEYINRLDRRPARHRRDAVPEWLKQLIDETRAHML